MNKKLNYKVHFLIPYYGQFPIYLRFFINSCGYNPNYKFLFFTDLVYTGDLPNNVEFIYLTFDEIVCLVKRKLKFDCKIPVPFKLCDFRPAYGKIFDDYIKHSNFWGHIDVDIILGKLDQFITTDMLSEYHVITGRENWASGPFTIYRNISEVNDLFQQSDDHVKVFTSNGYMRFDECSRDLEGGKSIFGKLESKMDISCFHTQVESMTHVLKNPEKLGRLKVLFKNLVVENLSTNSFVRIRGNEITLFKIMSIKSKARPSMLYHFHMEKDKRTFSYPQWNIIHEEFYVSPFGFYTKSEFRLYYFSAFKKGVNVAFLKIIDFFQSK